jgi:hypothetical protein
MSNKPGMAIEPVPGDAPAARWEMPVTVRRDDDGFDFAGPFVRGVRDDRHLGLIWGDLLADGTLRCSAGPSSASSTSIPVSSSRPCGRATSSSPGSG